MIDNTMKAIKPTGYFSLDVIENGKVVYHYEDPNQIMNTVGRMFAERAFGQATNPAIDDLQISALVLGSDGVDSNSQPKEIDPNRTSLFSEHNYWKGVKDPENSYLWESAWDVYSIPQKGKITLVTEGENYDHLGGETASAYMGTPTPANKEVGSTIIATYEPGMMTYEIELKKLSGTGLHKFSEAALYMKRGRKANGNPMGTIFSMKTFPPVKKSNACILKMKWVINFNVS